MLCNGKFKRNCLSDGEAIYEECCNIAEITQLTSFPGVNIKLYFHVNTFSADSQTLAFQVFSSPTHAVKRTGKNVRVTFNHRYAPRHTKIRELIEEGVIGQVFSVHFEWLLSTKHGADYFRRWHRDNRNSGGLLVHKSTHQFDLVNFWIDSQPIGVCLRGFNVLRS